ncbi:hypothetical protein [Thioclava sp. F28-4]|uniref:hypothetical protein n=1 Tax=Thioclava sp. F28-4 TaxID=1915315 RepID=UPI0011BA63B9|nr:hypothetical protein [Thioclava sp. F28-4]
MSFELFRDPITPAKPAGFNTQELRLYLGVGRNSVTDITQRFGIDKIHGLYPECNIWRQLFGIAPSDEVAKAQLREPLADIAWVSRMTGVPLSTLRNSLRNRQWRYDYGVQLGQDDGEAYPRLRRWIPALIRAQAIGSPAPSFTFTSTGPESPFPDPMQPRKEAETPETSVFSALFGAGAEISR